MSTALAEKTEAALPAMHPASDTDALLAIIERVASDPDADPERVAVAIANARLIASAPDLLAALTLCQSALAMMIAPDAIQSSTVLNAFAQANEAEAKARAAIQKAVA